LALGVDPSNIQGILGTGSTTFNFTKWFDEDDGKPSTAKTTLGFDSMEHAIKNAAADYLFTQLVYRYMRQITGIDRPYDKRRSILGSNDTINLHRGVSEPNVVGSFERSLEALMNGETQDIRLQDKGLTYWSSDSDIAESFAKGEFSSYEDGGIVINNQLPIHQLLSGPLSHPDMLEMGAVAEDEHIVTDFGESIKVEEFKCIPDFSGTRWPGQDLGLEANEWYSVDYLLEQLAKQVTAADVSTPTYGGPKKKKKEEVDKDIPPYTSGSRSIIEVNNDPKRKQEGRPAKPHKDLMRDGEVLRLFRLPNFGKPRGDRETMEDKP
jgi:hypothetical protein